MVRLIWGLCKCVIGIPSALDVVKGLRATSNSENEVCVLKRVQDELKQRNVRSYIFNTAIR